eukprot:1157626-Pelagomonas_calceolata.AAC.26
MKNLVLEEDLGALLPLEEDEHAVKCCLNSTEPRLYIATSHCDVLCLSLETFKVRLKKRILYCLSSRVLHQMVCSSMQQGM